MPEINNSLAAQIQVPQTDALGTLGKVSQFQKTQADTAFIQQQTAKSRFEVGSQIIGNILANGQGPDDRKTAISTARQYGQEVSPLMEQHILTAPDAQIKQYGMNLQRAGTSSATSVEQTGTPEANRAAGNIRGTNAGNIGIEPPPPIPINRSPAPPLQAAPPSPPISTNRAPIPSSKAIMGDDEAVRNGLYSPTPEQKLRGVVGPDYSQPGALTSAAQDLATRNKTAAERYAKTDQDYAAAQDVKARVAAIDHDIETLGPAWMGAGAETKAQFAKTWNGVVETAAGIFGIKPNSGIMFDPTKVATTEDFYKEQIRAGMSLINSSFGGGREAQSVVQMGKAAVAGLGNTYFGAKTVLNMIDSIAERQARLQEFKTRYPGPLYEAEIAFNKTFPPKMFTFDAIAKSIPDGAINALRRYGKDNADAMKAFDRDFHTPGLGKYILTGEL